MAIAPTVTYAMFKGAVLFASPHLLGEGEAHRAVDVKFENGLLKPFFGTSLELRTDEGTRTVFLHECCWVQTPECAAFAEGAPTCNEIYATGIAPFPVEGRVNPDGCEVTWRKLGVPCPSGVLTAAVITVGGNEKDVEGRSYAYAYRNSSGFTGQLSEGALVQLIRDGSTVLVSGWVVPSPEWGVTEVVIFRTVSGAVSGSAPGAAKLDVNAADTFWMEVGVVPIGELEFYDNRLNEELTNAYTFELLPPPPADLEGIGSIDSMNVLFGFVGRTLYFSKNNSPDAWPHRFVLDDTIRAVVESDGFIYVATDGRPYILSATDDCAHAGCRKVLKASTHAPLAGFGPRRMTAVPGGAVYPSKHGLVQVLPTGQVVFISQGLLTQEQWEQLLPESVVPVQFEGKLFVFGQRRSFVFYVAKGAEAGQPMAGLSELSDLNVLSAFVSRQGFLWLQKPDGMWLWEGSPQRRGYVWESLETRAATELNYGAFSVTINGGGGLCVTLVVDDEAQFSFQAAASGEYMIPTNLYGRRWRVRLEGSAQVSSYSMAQSAARLRI